MNTHRFLEHATRCSSRRPCRTPDHQSTAACATEFPMKSTTTCAAEIPSQSTATSSSHQHRRLRRRRNSAINWGCSRRLLCKSTRVCRNYKEIEDRCRFWAAHNPISLDQALVRRTIDGIVSTTTRRGTTESDTNCNVPVAGIELVTDVSHAQQDQTPEDKEER